ncbi:MAG: 5-formyltetrahydrofolate cyclo-ligase [Saprospiraceae bacterium]
MTISDQKIKLRKEMLAKRAKLSQQNKEKYDQWICAELLKIVKTHHCKAIHTYLPMGTEINILPLIENLLQEEIIVVCPKTLPNRKLEHLILSSLDQLEKGVFGTMHPANTKVYKAAYDLIIVPGLAFDQHQQRLGYGGGYYDQFLGEHPEALKVGIAYPFQFLEEIPSESHDIGLDIILVPGTSIKWRMETFWP